jgi:hypothetical protein
MMIHRNGNEPTCRSQSKTENLRRWLRNPENKNYFRGPEGSQRWQKVPRRPC